MARSPRVAIALLVLTCAAGPAAQTTAERDAVWHAFIAWWKTAPASVGPGGYAAKLKADGKSESEVEREIAFVTGQLGERSDWIGIFFDKVYATPPTGDPAKDLFPTQPSALLVESVADLKPGAALDVGVGQGRNAVYLAKQGWTVTGFDVSEGGLAATRANAEQAGVRVTTVAASYDSFDYGSGRWDLIVLSFAWAPVTDPEYVTRLHRSLRPGGRVVFEHLVQKTPGKGPNVIRPLESGQLRACFGAFDLPFYDEGPSTGGGWVRPGTPIVRMVAVKR